MIYRIFCRGYNYTISFDELYFVYVRGILCALLVGTLPHVRFCPLKGLSHEIDLKNFDKNLQNLAKLRDAAGF